jgi:hypothetical protein
VLIDESGLLLGPLLRRTWAPRGQTPTLVQGGRTHDKVSVAAALWLTPLRDRLGLAFQTLAGGYFGNQEVAGFLEAVQEGLGGRLVVIWDGGNMHQGGPISELLGRLQGSLYLERLPAYGAELMPVETLWSYLKYSRLSNFAPRNVGELNERAIEELTALQDDQKLLLSFFHASSLPVPRTLLF